MPLLKRLWHSWFCSSKKGSLWVFQALFRDLRETDRLALMEKHKLNTPQMGLVTAKLCEPEVTCAAVDELLASLGTNLTALDLSGLLRGDDEASLGRLMALGVTRDIAVGALKATGGCIQT